jgi:hypothetical protein
MRLISFAAGAFALEISGTAWALPSADRSLSVPTVVSPTAQHCTCVGGYSHAGGVVCTGWDCKEVIVSAPFKNVERRQDCPKGRDLYCDGPSCKLVCAPKQSKK